MRRREFLELSLGSLLIGCAAEVEGPGDGTGAADAAAPTPDAAATVADAAPPADDAAAGCDARVVTVHDTYAQALYLDGTYGPLTGVVRAVYVRDGVSVELEFWHGHGGVQHRFTLEPQHLAGLARGEKVYVETTEVDGHRHMLFVDPNDLDYRVPGGESVDLALC